MRVTPLRHTAIYVAVLLFALTYFFFQLTLEGTIYFREQCQMFLFSGEYICSFVRTTAPLSRLTDEFLTQFFYLRFAGAAIIALLTTVEFLTWRKALINHSQSTFYALAIALTDALMLGKAEHLLAAQISMIAAGALYILLYRLTQTRANVCVVVALQLTATLIFTWLFGLTSLIVLIAFGIAMAIRRSWSNVLSCIALIISVVALNFCLRRWLITTLFDVFFAPTSVLDYLTVGVVVVASVTLSVTTRYVVVAVAVLLLSSTNTACTHINLSSESFLYIATLYFIGNHKNVTAFLTKLGNVKHRYTSYYANLESARRGTLSDDLLQRYQPFEKALFITPNPQISWHSMLIGYDAFALCGCTNLAQHAAMLGNTFSPSKRNVRAVTNLAEINLACGDTLAAQKYTRLLGKTLYRKQLRPTSRLLQVEQKQDTIFGTNDILAQLQRTAEENPKRQITIDYLLCYQLLTKNIAGFAESFLKYRPTHVGRYYQEAMLIICAANELNISEFGFDFKIIEAFKDYTQLYERRDTKALSAKYADTYWYYFHFFQYIDNE